MVITSDLNRSKTTPGRHRQGAETRAMGCAGRSIEVWRSPTGNVTCEESPGCAARLCRYHALGHDPALILLREQELKGWEAGWKYITAG